MRRKQTSARTRMFPSELYLLPVPLWCELEQTRTGKEAHIANVADSAIVQSIIPSLMELRKTPLPLPLLLNILSVWLWCLGRQRLSFPPTLTFKVLWGHLYQWVVPCMVASESELGVICYLRKILQASGRAEESLFSSPTQSSFCPLKMGSMTFHKSWDTRDRPRSHQSRGCNPCCALKAFIGH